MIIELIPEQLYQDDRDAIRDHERATAKGCHCSGHTANCISEKLGYGNYTNGLSKLAEDTAKLSISPTQADWIFCDI